MQTTYRGNRYEVNFNVPIDLALPLRFGGDNPNCYGAEPPAVETIRAGGFVGSVAAGGSCNYQRLHLTPHGNGTHTETYGHIAPEGAAPLSALSPFAGWAYLLTVQPAPQPNDDRVITQKILSDRLTAPPAALVVRTRPNGADKATRQYTGTNPPYFAPEVGTWLAERGVEHLLTDLPSVDREQDGGRLAVHRGFWGYPAQPREQATITELIYAPESVPDGLYWLHLAPPRATVDAFPSRPVLYPVRAL